MKYSELINWLAGEGQTKEDCELVLIFEDQEAFDGFCQNLVYRSNSRQPFVAPTPVRLSDGRLKVTLMREQAGTTG